MQHYYPVPTKKEIELKEAANRKLDNLDKYNYKEVLSIITSMTELLSTRAIVQKR